MPALGALLATSCQDVPVPKDAPPAQETGAAMPDRVVTLDDYLWVVRNVVGEVERVIPPMGPARSSARLLIDTSSFAHAGAMLTKERIASDSVRGAVESILPTLSGRGVSSCPTALQECAPRRGVILIVLDSVRTRGSLLAAYPRYVLDERLEESTGTCTIAYEVVSRPAASSWVVDRSDMLRIC